MFPFVCSVMYGYVCAVGRTKGTLLTGTGSFYHSLLFSNDDWIAAAVRKYNLSEYSKLLTEENIVKYQHLVVLLFLLNFTKV